MSAEVDAQVRADALREAAAAIRANAQFEGVRGQRVVEMCARSVERLAQKSDSLTGQK